MRKSIIKQNKNLSPKISFQKFLLTYEQLSTQRSNKCKKHPFHMNYKKEALL